MTADLIEAARSFVAHADRHAGEIPPGWRERLAALAAALPKPALVYIGPKRPEYGPLQLVKQGGERTLCDLPLQPAWTEHDPAGRFICRDCARIAAAMVAPK